MSAILTRPQFNLEATRSFLEYLHPNLDGKQIDIRLICKGQAPTANLFPSIEAVCQFLERQDPLVYNVYVGVGPRRPGSVRGKKEDVAEIGHLFADLDGHDYKGGMEEAWNAICSCPLEPTMVVNSGNGFHAYWKLELPVRLESPEAIEIVEKYLARFVTYLGADPKCVDVSRILRLPGTLNIKDPANPKMATVVVPS